MRVAQLYPLPPLSSHSPVSRPVLAAGSRWPWLVVLSSLAGPGSAMRVRVWELRNLRHSRHHQPPARDCNMVWRMRTGPSLEKEASGAAQTGTFNTKLHIHYWHWVPSLEITRQSIKLVLILWIRMSALCIIMMGWNFNCLHTHVCSNDSCFDVSINGYWY